MLALSEDEAIVIQCKSFLGQENAESTARKLNEWFENAEDYLKNDNTLKYWIDSRKLKRFLVVDGSVKKTEKLLKNVHVMYYGSMLKDLVSMLQDPKIRKGKEEVPIVRLLCSLIDKKMLKE